MKKYSVCISLILLMLLCTSFSKNKEVKMQGYIKTYGNAPFVYPVLETKEGLQFSIKADNEIKDELFKTYGAEIKIKGFIIKPEENIMYIESAKDGYIEVTDWDYL